jgi:hypothetical protein
VSVLAAIDVGQLAHVVWVSIVAGVVVTVAFALVVRSSGRATEARRAGHTTAAAIHATLAAIFLAAFAAIVVVGITIMIKK